MRMRGKILALASIAALITAGGLAGEPAPSRYFPATGKGAVHQRALDLEGSAVVVVFALQPGYEDIPLLAYLRTAVGARAAVVYMTNGESTPGDASEKFPAATAGRRKEEAYAALRLLDVSARFLNFPDPGVVGSKSELEEVWNPDSGLARVGSVLRYFRPDLVLLEGDLRGDTLRSMRQRLMSDIVLKALRESEPSRRRGADTGLVMVSPEARVLAERDPLRRDFREHAYDRPHPVWRKTFRAIASEAAGAYRSLRVQLPLWVSRGDRCYAPVKSAHIVRLQSLYAGLPVIPPALRSLEALIRRSAKRTVGGVHAPLLPQVIQAIDSLDVHLGWERRLRSGGDLRLLAAWKDGLETLRCALLNVRVAYAVSESLITEKQIFYLRFEGPRAAAATGQTTIFFPGAMDHIWGVNESPQSQFTFLPPQKFEIITPQTVQYDLPSSQFGIRRTSLRTRFSFLIAHRDTTPMRSYFYRGELMLRTAPKRTFEILTPVVRALAGQSLICRLMNVSRDPFQGEMTIDDTLFLPVRKEVYLRGKDAVLLDTLTVVPRGEVRPGDYTIGINLPGGVRQTCVIRSFRAHILPEVRVALLSGIEGSPVGDALGRLGVPWVSRTAARGEAPDLSSLHVLIVDRDALAGLRREDREAAAIMSWVRGGGHLVVLPQYDLPDGGASVIPGMSFSRSPLLPPATRAIVDTADAFLRSPNPIRESDWSGWVVSRSFGAVRASRDSLHRVLVSSGNEGMPLVVTAPEGKGRITLVALDLISQLVNVHPGAHRLLADLLKPCL